MTYLWVGYVLTWVAVALYAWRLEARARNARDATRGAVRSRASAGAGGDPAPGRSGREEPMTPISERETRR